MEKPETDQGSWIKKKAELLISRSPRKRIAIQLWFKMQAHMPRILSYGIMRMFGVLSYFNHVQFNLSGWSFVWFGKIPRHDSTVLSAGTRSDDRTLWHSHKRKSAKCIFRLLILIRSPERRSHEKNREGGGDNLSSRGYSDHFKRSLCAPPP